MVYQLPSGKIIHIDVRTYLMLTDEEVLDMDMMDKGESFPDVWTESAVIKHNKIVRDIENYVDDEIEYPQDIILEDEIGDLDLEVDFSEDTGD